MTYSLRLTLCIVAAVTGLSACAPIPDQAAVEGESLHDGLLLNDHLSQPLVRPTVDDLLAMLAAPWKQSFRFGLADAPKAEQRVGSCEDYGRALNAGLRPSLAADPVLLAELAVMCRAARALSEARPAGESYIEPLPFDGKLPSLLPADLALRTSTEDHARFASAASETRWADVANLQSVEIHGPEHAVYKQPGGAQVVRLVGRGDIDGDGVEDLLITSRDMGEDGALLGYRLFIISRFAPETSYVVLSEFSPS